MPRCLLLLSMLLASVPSLAAEPTKLETATDKISYSSGYRLGEYYRKERLPVRSDLVERGFQDGLQGIRPALPKGEMRVHLNDPKKALADEKAVQKERYRGEGRDFLQANATKEGVVALPSGLQYKVLQQGDGVVPQPGDSVRLRFQGTKIDGQPFDRSPEDGTPVEMALDKLVPGMAEALQLMPAGSRWMLYLPADLAFGERSPMADQVAVFDLELVEVVGK